MDSIAQEARREYMREYMRKYRAKKENKARLKQHQEAFWHRQARQTGLEMRSMASLEAELEELRDRVL